MNYFRSLNMGQRMLACFGLMMGVLLAISFFWRASVIHLGSSLDEAVNRTAVKLRMAGDLRTEFRTMWAEARGAQFSLVIGLLHAKEAQGKSDAYSAGCIACHSQDMKEEGHRRFVDASGRLRRELEELGKLDPSPGERRLLAAIERDLDEWLSLYAQYLQLAGSDRYDDAHTLMADKIAPLLADADRTVAALMDAQRQALAQAAESAAGDVAANRRRALLLAAFGAALGCFTFLATRGMTGSLRRIAADVETGSASVAGAARQSAAASASLAQGASEQAASLSEAAGAGAGIGKVARGNEERAQSAVKTAVRARRESDGARRLLDSTRAAMNEAEAASDRMNAMLRVIDEIAFQTNILALNAAVEAARAGEAGLGFAVVADEVRTLARRCAEASAQITSLVANASAKNRGAKESLGQFDEVLGQLAEGSAALESLLAEVAEGSRRQNQELDQLSGSLRRMDEVTHANAGVAEESAAAAAHLEQQAEALGSAARNLAALIGRA